MDFDAGNIIALLALFGSFLSYLFSHNEKNQLRQEAKQAQKEAEQKHKELKEQAERALAQSDKALKDSRLHTLFSGFEQANDALMRNPELLNSVHGLNNDNDLESIAYLGILIDAFHHYWGKEYDNDYEKAIKEEPSNFMHKIAAVEANYHRWEKLKSINYGDDDTNFVKVMDKIFENAMIKS